MLFVAGPALLHPRTKAAMRRDYAPRAANFRDLIAEVRQNFLDLVGAKNDHTVIPLQGSGTFAIEATIGTIIPKTATVGILSNGAYAIRASEICHRLNLKTALLQIDDARPLTGAHLRQLLLEAPNITHVYLVHCETQSGIVNNLTDVAIEASLAGISVIVDAMSTVGCFEMSSTDIHYDALITSGNKCIEGPPGVAFVVARKEALRKCEGRATSFSLDLFSQWKALEESGEFRFTPPTQVMAGVREAQVLLAEEGGVLARNKRYFDHADWIRREFSGLGIAAFLPASLSSPAVVTFMPSDHQYNIEQLVDVLYQAGTIIYPSRVKGRATFQVGCMGQIKPKHIRSLIRETRAFLLRTTTAQ